MGLLNCFTNQIQHTLTLLIVCIAKSQIEVHSICYYLWEYPCIDQSATTPRILNLALPESISNFGSEQVCGRKIWTTNLLFSFQGFHKRTLLVLTSFGKKPVDKTCKREKNFQCNHSHQVIFSNNSP